MRRSTKQTTSGGPDEIRRPPGCRAITLATTLALTSLVAASTATAEAAATDGPQHPGIVGGTTATTATYPWQVRLEISTNVGSFLCGGAVIHSRIVLTAAHCLSGDFTVQGVTAYFGRDLASSGGTAAAAVGGLASNSYNPGTFSYDWATIYFDTPIPAVFTPIKIAGKNERSLWSAGRVATAVGFGNTTEGGQTSPTLLQVPMPIQADSTCSGDDVYGTAFSKASMLCAGAMAGGKSTCQGDSGGPLIVRGDKDVWRIAGIVSWAEGCARPNRPTVFTRIAEPAVTALLQQEIDLVKQNNPSLFPGTESAIDIVGSGAVPYGCTAAKKKAKSAKATVASKAKAVKAAKTKAAKAKAVKALKAAQKKSKAAQKKAKKAC